MSERERESEREKKEARSRAAMVVKRDEEKNQ
jgi:hypothetical protein